MIELDFHPAASEFPLLDQDRIHELAEDIKANGQCEPIRTHDGKIIDGRNRYMACREAGVEPRFQPLPTDLNPFAYVWSLNGQRRDLTQDQRYLIWKSCARKSGEWQARRRHVRDKANLARSESQRGVPKTETAERAATNCGSTFNRGSNLVAAASGTNRGAVERMDRLERDRPDLAEKVKLGQITSADALREVTGPHVANNSGDNEWYTPEDYIRRAVTVMGGIDVDPASSAEANRVVGAARFHTTEDDGLTKTWSGRVFMNPPYAQPLIQQFCETLVDRCQSGHVTQAVVLVNNATETRWFQALLGAASAVCFPAGRVKFWHPQKKSAPLQGQAVVYIGQNRKAFTQAFKDLGSVCHVAR
jgi:hypothetical protein